MGKLKLYSYGLLFITLVMVVLLHLGTPFITVLFAYFVLRKLGFLKRKWLTILVFIALVAVICLGLGYFIDQAVKTLPHVAETAVPGIIQYAKERHLELPFSDWDELRAFAIDSLKGELRYVGNFARAATKQFVFLVIGIVIGISLYLNPATDLNIKGYAIRNNLYTCFFREIAARFRSLWHSFAMVMGAQLTISSINTVLTLLFVVSTQLPYAPLVVIATFLCGLLPIVGNLISNSIIVAIAFTKSPELAIWGLIFLVLLHKLEYFLNSKIIGERIKNPVWLTLVGLVIGERLMGIGGMILAPVILHYLKMEASQIRVEEATDRNIAETAKVLD